MEQRPAGNGPDLFFIQLQCARQHRRKRRNPFAVTPRPRVLRFDRLAPSLNRGLPQSFFPGNILPEITPITSGRCSPAEPSSVHDRSKPFGPIIFISHRSFAWEPTIDTRQSPGLSASTCSITAATSRCDAESPVWCISTKTAISEFIVLDEKTSTHRHWPRAQAAITATTAKTAAA